MIPDRHKLFATCILLLATSCDGFGTDFLTKDIAIGVEQSSSSSSTSSGSSGGGVAPDDDDADGLSNEVEETFEMETRVADTDFDGYGDGLEFVVDTGDPLDGSRSPSPLNFTRTLEQTDVVIDPSDSDLDGLGDTFESNNGLDPNNPDTDGDGYQDGLELVANSNPFDESSRPAREAPPAPDGVDRLGTPPADTDGDGLSSDVEALQGTRSDADDTDRDGFSDGLEVLMGSNPNDEANIPNFNIPEPPESTTSET